MTLYCQSKWTRLKSLKNRIRMTNTAGIISKFPPAPKIKSSKIHNLFTAGVLFFHFTFIFHRFCFYSKFANYNTSLPKMFLVIICLFIICSRRKDLTT